MAQKSAASTPEVQALLELERREMQAPGTMPPNLKQKLEGYRQQGIVKPLAGDPKTIEGERKSNAFLIRALGANQTYEKTGVGPRSFLGQKLQDNAPNVLNELPGFIGNSPQRQVADTTQDEFIAASLRQDSGAAIPPEEMERQRRIYFPMPGDGPEVLAAKRAARKRAIEGLVASAGAAVTPEVRKQFDEFITSFDAPAGADTPAEGKLSPEQIQTELERRLREKDGSPGATIQWLIENDRPPNAEQIDAIVKNWGNQNPDVRPSKMDEYARRLYMGVGDIAEFAGDTLGLVANPVNAGLNALGIPQALTGEELGTDLGAAFRGAIGAPEPKTSSEQMASAINKGAAGGLGFAGLARGGAALAAPYLGGGGGGGSAQVARIAVPVMERVAAAPVADTVAGATGGAAGETARQSGAGPIGQFVATLAGGVGGLAGTRSARSLADVFLGGGNKSPVVQAADRLDMKLLPAVTGGPVTRGLTAAANQGTVSQRPIFDAASTMVEGGRSARDRAANLVGEGLDELGAGEAVRKAANVYVKQTGTTGSALYTRAFERAGDTRVSLPKAGQMIDSQLAELRESPDAANSALVKEFETLRQAIASGQFTIRGIRNMRTRLREEAEYKGLRGSDTQRRYGMILDAAADDIVDGLRAAGKDDAAAAFKTADDFWKRRVETIDEVLDPILGRNTPRSGESIFATVERMANKKGGDSKTLSRLLNAMPEPEANNVRATFIQRLGQATDGHQNQAGDAFSFNTFMTRWNQMSPRAKAMLFPEQSRRMLNDLATIAEEVKGAEGYANRSNTARGVAGQVVLSGGFGAISPQAMLTAALMQYGSGRLLASPGFARLIARAPKEPSPRAASDLIDRVSSLAAKEPLIANDLGQLADRLRAFQQAPAPLAAEERQGQ